MSIIGQIIVFVSVAILAMVRLALGIVLSIVAPVVLPVLVLLSGGGLLVTVGFACAGHWSHALKGLVAWFACTVALALFAGLAQLVNPYLFSVPVIVTNREGR